MLIDLPWPDPILWPNGPEAKNRGHKAAVVKQHREWAAVATWEAKGAGKAPEGDNIPITLIVHAKPRGPLPDKDNCIAAAKSLLDGIADALKVNDRQFAAPVVVFEKPRDGRFVVEVGLG